MAINSSSMTISFTEFMELCEVYDKDVVGRSQITQSGEGGRIQRKRKSDAIVLLPKNYLAHR